MFQENSYVLLACAVMFVSVELCLTIASVLTLLSTGLWAELYFFVMSSTHFCHVMKTSNVIFIRIFTEVNIVDEHVHEEKLCC